MSLPTLPVTPEFPAVEVDDYSHVNVSDPESPVLLREPIGETIGRRRRLVFPSLRNTEVQALEDRIDEIRGAAGCFTFTPPGAAEPKVYRLVAGQVQFRRLSPVRSSAELLVREIV